MYYKHLTYLNYNKIENEGISDKRQLEIILETLRKDVYQKSCMDLSMTDTRDKIPKEIFWDVFYEL